MAKLQLCPRDDSFLSSRGFPLAPGTPRPETGRRHEAGLLASGSLLTARLPKPSLSGIWTGRYRLQLRGQPWIFSTFPNLMREREPRRLPSPPQGGEGMGVRG